MKEYLLLFVSCIKTKGVKRSLISDLQRGGIYFITNDFFDFIEDCKTKPFNDLLLEYDNESQNLLKDNISFLLKHDLGFLTDKPELFPEISDSFESPFLIDNCIIDRNVFSEYNLSDAIQKISKLDCSHYQLRFFHEINFNYLIEIFSLLDKIESVLTIEFIFKYFEEINKDQLFNLVRLFPKTKSILVFSAPEDKIIQNFGERERGKMGNIIFISDEIKDESHCGIINPFYAVQINTLKKHLESKNFNSCLHRKIGIDTLGFIKNCPSMKNNFGHIDKIENLYELIKSNDFKKYSKLNKEQISICKICEFRHVCSDCRAYTENNDILNKPTKCNYDPSTNIWN